MLDVEIVALAKRHLKEAQGLPLPDGFLIDTQWKNHQENVNRDLDGYTNCVEIIQKGNGSPFNHRSNFDPGLIDRKVKALKDEFPEFDFMKSDCVEHPDASDSSTQFWNGRRMSNIFFWHLYPVLACLKHVCKTPKRILEIGGGCGDQARLWKFAIPDLYWVGVDLPECLFFAEVFLRRNFPDALVRYVTSGFSAWDVYADFILCPVQLCEKVKLGHYDFAMNQGSMQEMPKNTVDFWLRFLESADIDAFYSLNYHVTSLDRTQGWDLVRQVKEPLVITMDSGVNLEQAWKIRRNGIAS